MKVYVVVSDPNYYCHYDSVWSSMEGAQAYVMDRERGELERHPGRVHRKPIESGRWAEYRITDLDKVALVWGYPGYGDEFGIIEEETGDDERLQKEVQEVPEVAGHQGRAADRTN